MKWTHENIPDQSGKTAIVTGASSGLGFETAKALAEKGARVILACRNAKKGSDAASAIRTDHPEALTDFMGLDLSELSSIRDFANAFKAKNERLDLLINNAGVMVPPRGQTKDGFELQFGTNHLGHFMLTALLFGVLKNTGQARVISVSSMAHRQGRFDPGNLNAEKKYSRMGAYGQSKLANLLFIYELQRRIDAAGLDMIAAASHPGWTATNLQRHSGFFTFLNPVLAQKPCMGALPTLYAATAGDVKGGDFYGPGGFMEIRGYPVKVRSSIQSYSLEAAALLWELSEKMTGASFRI